MGLSHGRRRAKSQHAARRPEPLLLGEQSGEYADDRARNSRSTRSSACLRPPPPATAVEYPSGVMVSGATPCHHGKDEPTRKARSPRTHIVAKARTGICPFRGPPPIGVETLHAEPPLELFSGGSEIDPTAKFRVGTPAVTAIGSVRQYFSWHAACVIPIDPGKVLGPVLGADPIAAGDASVASKARPP